MTNEELVQEGLVRIEEAMEFLSMSRASLYRLIDEGALPTVKLACTAGFHAGHSSPLRRHTSSRGKGSRPDHGLPAMSGPAPRVMVAFRRQTKTAGESDAPPPPRRSVCRPSLLPKVSIKMKCDVSERWPLR